MPHRWPTWPCSMTDLFSYTMNRFHDMKYSDGKYSGYHMMHNVLKIKLLGSFKENFFIISY